MAGARPPPQQHSTTVAFGRRWARPPVRRRPSAAALAARMADVGAKASGCALACNGPLVGADARPHALRRPPWPAPTPWPTPMTCPSPTPRPASLPDPAPVPCSAPRPWPAPDEPEAMASAQDMAWRKPWDRGDLRSFLAPRPWARRAPPEPHRATHQTFAFATLLQRVRAGCSPAPALADAMARRRSQLAVCSNPKRQRKRSRSSSTLPAGPEKDSPRRCCTAIGRPGAPSVVEPVAFFVLALALERCLAKTIAR